MNRTMTSVMKRVTVCGLLLAACIISLAMAPLPASAGNNNAPGTVTTWGEGTRINRSLPVKVALPPTVTTVIQIAAGRNDSYAITNDGLHVWGSDFASQLGNGSFGILPDGSSDAGQTFRVKLLSTTKGGGGSTKDLTCAYLYSVITYPYVDPAIKAYAISLYVALGCKPAL